MPKETTPTTQSIETGNKKITYNIKFRNLLRENPGIIKAAIVLADKAVAEYAPPDNMSFPRTLRFVKRTGQWMEEIRHVVLDKNGKIDPEITTHGGWRPMGFVRGTLLVPGKPIVDEQTGLEVTVIGRSNRESIISIYDTTTRFDKTDYLKITIRGQSFFVKRSFVTVNPGFTEFKNVMSAKEALRDLDFVKVVDAKLGYQDKNESWYIENWEELERDDFSIFDKSISFNDYGERKEAIYPEHRDPNFLEKEKEYYEIEKKADLIKEKLKKVDLANDIDANLFYNSKTKTFILLDVTSSNLEKTLGNALRRPSQ